MHHLKKSSFLHFLNFDLFYYNSDILFSYSNKQDRKKKPTNLSVPFSPLMYCLNTKMTIDSLIYVNGVYYMTQMLLFQPFISP